ncbi:DnaJ C-terminal domain-containing protein [Candidatus Methylacidithermus pantelleriae]|uniref:Curved DNA-binding protein n=1 Tax=Candidatus Methylacidithermus pantelleriae TaxID=2744239 RepID=A0A8J2BMV3_9BACT|nr:DnaJ C-terminal domain-containing protein [Candidatus Methylacidithermus pantelleriae]CAF0694018.1 Curved DNA-binding protein [Candidatus Methylacidithermus pantelleriae]
MEFKDYYAILGVPETASADDIRQAFRKLARQYHPDVAKDKVRAEEKFKEINEAYEVLGDPDKRRRYDELRRAWKEGAVAAGVGGGPRAQWRWEPVEEEGFPFGFEGTGFSDFFERFFGPGADIFGELFRRRAGTFRGDTGVSTDYERGRDLEADILVSLEEVLRGGTRTVRVRFPSSQGRTIERVYQVRIPPGVREGQRIRLPGQGEPGRGNAPSGDLYLRVRLERHPVFQVGDSDLYCELPIAPWEAVLGGKAELQSLDGKIELKIPPGSQAGSRLRLPGLGLPRPEGGRGDLYVTLRVVVPEKVTAKERALWEELARVSSFRPRAS